MLPIKSHTYVLDINVNDTSKLGWKYSHEVTARYNMTDLSPSSFVNFADRMRDDENLAVLYSNTYSNGGSNSHIESCDDACRLEVYCSMTNTVYLESKDCQNLPRYNIKTDPVASLMEVLSDPWVSPK